jgi:CubicO group peptidase (beta-lactamase class C family)
VPGDLRNSLETGVTAEQPWRRPERLRTLLNRHTESGAVSGLLVTVAAHGVPYLIESTAPGTRGSPIASDSLVRIGSLTKPLVAAATMALAERGQLGLDDPIERFIPELGARRVLPRLDGPLDETEPARRPITVRHLLTCTMGFGFPMSKGPHPIMREAAALQLGLGPPKPGTPHRPDQWVRQFASLPLMAQPGDVWMYDTSFAVLGVLLSRLAGVPLGVVLREQILDPLEMVDTDFFVPLNKLQRLVPCARADADAREGPRLLFDDPAASHWAQPPAFSDAAGGLVSTADDYLTFAHMLLAKGVHRGQRILAEESVALMVSNHVHAAQRGPASAPFLGSQGWAWRVRRAPTRR